MRPISLDATIRRLAQVARGAGGIAALALHVACNDPTDVRPDPSPRSEGATKATFDCGTVELGLRVQCAPDEHDPTKIVVESTSEQGPIPIDTKLQDPETLTALPATYHTIALSNARCGNVNPELAKGDPVDEVRAALVAACVPRVPEAAGAIAYEASFMGEASRICRRPSVATVAPHWRSAVTLEESGVYRVSVRSWSDVDLDFGKPRGACRAIVDGSPADPILAGTSRLATRHIRGPASVAIELDCTKLPQLDCPRLDEPLPATDRALLQIRVEVERME